MNVLKGIETPKGVFFHALCSHTTAQNHAIAYQEQGVPRHQLSIITNQIRKIFG